MNGGHLATAIWNCDETSFTTAGKGFVRNWNWRKVSSGERGRTSPHCVSAAGSYIPPLFVFSRKRMVTALMNGALVGMIGAVDEHGSGYSDADVFMKWLKHVEMAGCTKEHPHVFLLGGHKSHKTLEAIDFAREHGVIMLTFLTLHTPAPTT